MLTAKLDEYGRGAWIALMVLGFALYWPIGLALLAFMMFSGRMRCGSNMPGRWYNAPSGGPGQGRSGCGWGGFGGGWRQAPSGNRAFDEYRAETLKRLEEEQKEFVEYLERLRRARDKEEFDQFMAERRRGSQGPDVTDTTTT
jgi:hypothetical protein